MSAAGGLLGAETGAGLTRFGVYATRGQRCEVRLFAPDGRTVLGTHAMQSAGPYHHAELDGVGPGALYKFVLDGRELPDPCARFLPFGVHGPAQVTVAHHTWQHGRGPGRPLAEQVIYELHVGTFSPEGTFEGVRRRLPELAALGVTTLELMPVAAFDGERGWGYDGVALYAPHAAYGTPDELRALVDEAHGLGLGVLLDVVYNHLGPSGNYLGAYSDNYYTGAIKNAWGDSPNYAHPALRRHVLDSALYWLTEFRLDGLRLDATHAIVDPSPRHILAELADRVRARGDDPRPLLIAEDEANDPGLVCDFRLDAIWADDFHHQLRVTLTGEQDGYYAAYRPGAGEIARAIREGWLYRGEDYAPWGRPRGKPAEALPAEAFVYCISNHDQVGNRALGERLAQQISTDAWCAASTLLLFLPATPLLFMGQEWAASTPFQFFTDHEPELGRAISRGRREEFKRFLAFADPAAREAIPDPQDRATFLRSRLRWDERDQGDHARVLALYRALLELRRTDPVLSDNAGTAARARTTAHASGSTLVVRRSAAQGDETRVLVVNLGVEPAPLPDLGDDENADTLTVLLRSDGSKEPATTLPPATAMIFRSW
jgi:maltooligosyltrehalose trehalohydrolase